VTYYIKIESIPVKFICRVVVQNWEELKKGFERTGSKVEEVKRRGKGSHDK
jgi:hypothetical protein